MTTIPDDIPKEPYDTETLKRITEVLNVPDLSEEQTAKLQHAAWVYLSLSEIEPRKDKPKAWLSWPTRSEQRESVEDIAEAAHALSNAFKNWHFAATEVGQLPPFDRTALDQLAKSADRIARQIPRGGAVPKHARKYFCELLIPIFEEATKRSATYGLNPASSKRDSPFLKFARAALKPLDKHATTGLGDVVLAVIRSQRTK